MVIIEKDQNKNIYHIVTRKVPLLLLDEENAIFNDFDNDIKNHYVRIYNYDDKKGFDVHIYCEREKPLYDVTIEEKYLKMNKDIYFKEKCFDLFNILSINNIRLSKFYSDIEQIRAFMFYVSLYTVDEIIFKNKNYMLGCYLEHQQSNDDIIKNNLEIKEDELTKKIISLCAMGMYVKKINYFDLHTFIKERYIYLSKELIDECYNELKENESLKNLKFRNIDLLNIVFFHEIGHSAFDHSNLTKPFLHDRTLAEKRANYFSSIIYEGLYDKEMYELSKMQPSIYHNPLLKSFRFTLPDYYNEVNSLFKEEK